MKTQQQLILDAHVLVPGEAGMQCLAMPTPENVTPEFIGHDVVCPACGNTLGRDDQLIIQVRERGAYFKTLAFIG